MASRPTQTLLWLFTQSTFFLRGLKIAHNEPKGAREGLASEQLLKLAYNGLKLHYRGRALKNWVEHSTTSRFLLHLFRAQQDLRVSRLSSSEEYGRIVAQENKKCWASSTTVTSALV